jgi:hypothetical protein
LRKGIGGHLAFTLDGRSLFTSPHAEDRVGLRQWDVAAGSLVRNLGLPEKNEWVNSNSNGAMRVTPDGHVLVLSWKNGRRGDESILTKWNPASGECLLHERVPWLEDSALTPDGVSVVALDSRAQAVQLLDVATGQVRLQFQTDRIRDPNELVLGCNLVVSPSGRLVAARLQLSDRQTPDWRKDSDIRIHDLAAGRQLLKVPESSQAVFAFSPDDRLFAVAGASRVRFWETASWREVGSIDLASDKDLAPGPVRSLDLSPDGRLLATGHANSTILLWDATLRGGARGGPLTAAETEANWKALAEEDAPHGYAAVWRLVDDPQRSVALLRQQLQPTAGPRPEVLGRLLNDLESESFHVRNAAEQELRAFGELAESGLRQALRENPALEKRRRLESLLDVLNPSAALTGEALRGVRAVQALERIGTVEAREVLQRLAQGTDSTRLTRAAKEALGRIQTHGAP